MNRLDIDANSGYNIPQKAAISDFNPNHNDADERR